MDPTLNLLSCSSLTRAALEASPQALLVTNATGHILFANQNVHAWFGYTRSEIYGRCLTGMVPEVNIRDVDAHHETSLSQFCSPSRQDGTRRVIRKDGSEVFAQVSFVEVEERNERLILANFSCTEVNRPEIGILETERLDAIAQMISGLAHESRNALQRAVACLDLLELDLCENDKQMELSSKIRRSLSDLLENYDEVRRFAQPLTLHPTRVELMSVCAEAFHQIDDLVPRSNNELTLIRKNECEDAAYVDVVKVQEAFRHVLENALDQRPGEMNIEVECKDTCLAGASAIQISIRDDGESFSEEALRRAFDPFYTTKQHGTGLGLSICRRIIQAHGGMVRASNPACGGGEVEIILPRHRPPK